jgi:hypothetical protein
VISLIIIFFLFFHLYSQGNNTFVFSILDFIINEVQLLSLLKNTDNYDLLQNINAETVIKNLNSKKQIILINKNNYDADEYISIGAWVLLNNSLILQQLKGEPQKMQSKLFLIKAFMNIILL